jgi:hypothetical protein
LEETGKILRLLSGEQARTAQIEFPISSLYAQFKVTGDSGSGGPTSDYALLGIIKNRIISSIASGESRLWTEHPRAR